MNNAKGFIENIQGLLIYLKHKNKNGLPISLRELLEKDEETFKYILEDFNENHSSVLEGYFKNKDSRAKGLVYASFIDTYQHFEPFNPNAPDEEFEKALKETEEYYKELISKLPSKFQELDSFGSVHYLLNELMEAAPLTGSKISARPEIGTISTEIVNACTLTLETEESIIFVEEDILSFIHLFSKVFCQCLSLGAENEETFSLVAKKEDIFKNIENNPEIITRFQDFLKSYIIDGSPRKSEQYNLKRDNRYWLCTHLMISAELFLIGHELGHVIANHQTARRKFRFFNQDYEASFDNRDWEKEFEADNIGMYLAMQAMARKGFKADFCYLGIEPFFIVQDIALRARKILKDGNEDISDDFRTHPPNIMRRQRTRNELKRITPNDLYLDAIYLPDIINETMEYLWEKSKGIFYKAFQEKIKIAKNV